MFVRAISNFSINRPDDKDGNNPDSYKRGYIYDVPKELFEDKRGHFQQLDDDVDLTDFSKYELDALARRAEIENPQDMNKDELADALKESRGPVKTGKSLMALTREKLNEKARGLNIDQPEKMANKTAVVEAIEAV